MIRVALSAALLLASQPAAAADQFDLSCISAKRNKKTVPFPIKIDLARGEWCIGKCEAVFRIKSVTSSTIVLGETETPTEGRAGQRIDRLTGEYYFYEEKPAPGETWPPTALFGKWEQRGTCTPQPFTGFGDEKAKF